MLTLGVAFTLAHDFPLRRGVRNGQKNAEGERGWRLLKGWRQSVHTQVQSAEKRATDTRCRH